MGLKPRIPAPVTAEEDLLCPVTDLTEREAVPFGLFPVVLEPHERAPRLSEAQRKGIKPRPWLALETPSDGLEGPPSSSRLPEGPSGVETGVKGKLAPTMPIDWGSTLSHVGKDALLVWEKRGIQADADAWFVAHDMGKKKVLYSIQDLKKPTLGGIQEKFFPTSAMPVDQLVVLAGKLLARLLPADLGNHRTPRAWFGKYKNAQGYWISPLSYIANSQFNGLAKDFDQLLWTLDEMHRLFFLRTGTPSAELFPLRKQADGMGWDLSSLSTILTKAQIHGVSWRGLVLVLIQRELEKSRAVNRLPYLNVPQLISYLPGLTPKEIHALPKAGAEEWKVEALLVMGLPGGCALPDRVRYGLDFRALERPDMRLLAITEGGQAVYQDAKGKIHSEGNPVPMQPQVQAWGKSIQLFVNAQTVALLLSRWYDPPKLCPWVWYQLCGTGEYDEEGQPFYPDPKYRPPVQWLEATG